MKARERSGREDSQPQLGYELSQEVREFVGPSGERRVPERKLYQDEIYGTKELSPLGVALIDTPEVQRLSHVYQLGFTYAIFRGANHYRFDHCVGTYFMVRTLLRKIVQNHARLYSTNNEAFGHPGLKISPRFYIDAPGTPGARAGTYSPMGRWRGLTEIVSAAGMLHDLGHVPAGHTLEDEFSVLQKHDSLGGPRLFEMLYGPRHPITDGASVPKGGPNVRHYFSEIDREALPHPDLWERVPLPWVFEDGTYDRFFPDSLLEVGTPGVAALTNWEIRDLIYLILSFKETIRDQEYITFRTELEIAKKETKDEASTQRLAFLESLYYYYSRPIDLGSEYEALPLFCPFMADVVGNTICADLLDYLVRDGKRLKLDMRDNARLQRYLVIRPASAIVEYAESLRLTIHAVHRNGLRRRDTVSDLLDLMRERHRFAEVVYYHPKKAAFSTMLAKAMESLPEEARPVDGPGIYPAPWSPRVRAAVRANIVHFGDEALLTHLAAQVDRDELLRREPPKESLVRDLLRGIRYRHEYRRLFTLDDEAARMAGGARKFRDSLRLPDDEGVLDAGRKKMEARLARVVERAGLPGWNYDHNYPVLIYCPNIRMQAKEVAAHVELVEGRVMPLNLQEDDTPLRGEIELLNAKYRHLWRLYLFVHPMLVGFGPMSHERAMVLSTIVDSFCHTYGVAEEHRRKGCRYQYVPQKRRLDEHFDRWSQGLSDTFPRMEIRRRADDVNLWTDVLGGETAPLPVAEAEYESGFSRAMVVVAADSASVRERRTWPEHVRGLKAEHWHRPVPIARSERARRSGLDRLKQLAETTIDHSGSRRLEALNDWDEFRKKVAVSLGGKE
ncbi:MAG: hypothetical protein ACRDGM_15300 [bacterium]